MVYKMLGVKKNLLFSFFLLLYGAIFLLTLLATIFNWNVFILDNFLTIGLAIFGATLFGKIFIILTSFILIISGIVLLYRKEWGIKTIFYFSILVIMFLIYLLIGIIRNINTGHQTSASLAVSIAVPFLPFLLLLGFILWRLKKYNNVKQD